MWIVYALKDRPVMSHYEEDCYQRSEFDNVHLSSLQKILIAFNFAQFSEKLY